MCSANYVELPKRLVATLWRETLAAYPREACALLFGCSRDPGAVVEQVCPVENAAIGLNDFSIRDSDLMEACKNSNKPLIGLFHSHRTQANPSSSDRHALQRQPLIWLIACSGHPPSGAAFRGRSSPPSGTGCPAAGLTRSAPTPSRWFARWRIASARGGTGRR